MATMKAAAATAVTVEQQSFHVFVCALSTKDYILQLTALNKLLIFAVKSRNRNMMKKAHYIHITMTNLLFWMLFIKNYYYCYDYIRRGKYPNEMKYTKETNTPLYRFVCSTFELKWDLCLTLSSSRSTSIWIILDHSSTLFYFFISVVYLQSKHTTQVKYHVKLSKMYNDWPIAHGWRTKSITGRRKVRVQGREPLELYLQSFILAASI